MGRSCGDILVWCLGNYIFLMMGLHLPMQKLYVDNLDIPHTVRLSGIDYNICISRKQVPKLVS